MIKVLRHGAKFSVKNPITGNPNTMANVVFVEEGRSGGDAKMTGSSDFLSNALGTQVGFNQLRTHTQPVLEEKLELFPVGKELPGHINRGIYSTPQLRQQQSVQARMIDGRPSYFKTWFDTEAKEDEDKRISLDVQVSVNPNSVFNAQIGAAEVRVISQPQAEFSTQEAGVGQETLAES